MKTVLSGMRPTGALHIGHLEGVLNEWVALQERHECFYFVADWHALTTNPDTSCVRDHAVSMVKDWLAAGVDPERSTLFIQSQVPQHAELHTALSMLVNLGRLERLPTFNEYLREIVRVDGIDEKRRDERKRAQVAYGFLGYPVLQSADILLYNTSLVPVGEDQLPHLELTRELARRFNSTYERVFVVPEPHLSSTPRMLGSDGRKMSKSYGNVLAPTDEGAALAAKIARIPSDPARVQASTPGTPEHCRVYDFHEIYSPNRAVIAQECRDASRGCKECKLELAARLTERYAGFRERRGALSDSYVLDVLMDGSARARERAASTMEQVRGAMRLDYRRDYAHTTA